MGGEEWGGVNHQPISDTKSFWYTILESPDVNLLKILEDTPGDLSGPQGALVLEDTPGDLSDPQGAVVLEDTPVNVSSPQGVQFSEELSSGTQQYFVTDKKKLNKRKIDKNYRQRVKEKKQKLALDVEELGIKNALLNSEIHSYQQDINLMMKDLQTKAEEREELRISIDKLKHDVAKGKEFANRLYREPSIQKDVLECPVQLQIALLKNVYAVLDQNCNWEEYQRKSLEEEITKLESDNKILQVQHQALLERIHKTRNS